MTDREAFEKFAALQTLRLDKCIDVTRRNEYFYKETANALIAWQAACKYKDEQRKIVEKVDHQ